MLRPNLIPDKTILQKVNQRLARAGLGSQSKITVTVRNGHVTLAGTLHNDMQRRSLLNAARGAVGIRGLVDQLQTKPKEKNREVHILRSESPQ
jgi:osmotically-inducible protein OsmY